MSNPKFDYYSFDGYYDFALIKLKKPSTIVSITTRFLVAGKKVLVVSYRKRRSTEYYYSKYLRNAEVVSRPFYSPSFFFKSNFACLIIFPSKTYLSTIYCQNSIYYSKETKKFLIIQ